jgi:hypothetical protein
VITPLGSNPTTSGRWTRSDIRGTQTMIAMAMLNFGSVGKATACERRVQSSGP